MMTKTKTEPAKPQRWQDVIIATANENYWSGLLARAQEGRDPMTAVWFRW